MTTTDEDEAQSAIDRAVKASDKTFSKREYKGVEYKASAESAVGIVEGFAVAGTEPEFKQTVDAAKGDGLDSDDRFKKAMDGLEDDRLGAFYLDFKAVLDAAVREDPETAQQLEQAKRLFPVDKIGAVAGAFMADGDRLAIDATAQIPEGGAPGRRSARSTRAVDAAAGRAAGRLLGRVRLAGLRRRRSRASTSRSPARSAARRSRTSCARSSGWTSSRTSSPGSATSPSSRAGPTADTDRGRRW